MWPKSQTGRRNKSIYRPINLLRTTQQMGAAEPVGHPLIHLLLVLRLYEPRNGGQRIEFREVRRVVHFFQRRSHAAQAHFCQFVRECTQEAFSSKHYLSPSFRLLQAKFWLRERRLLMSVASALITKAPLLRSSFTLLAQSEVLRSSAITGIRFFTKV